ncbi:SDR family oxidoreductase [Salinadaptatus halalkaliphilus]|uniref:SDR family oxidoreductase n=1 Tax=Salinadaptatus halalkaliphilus TaxID=2419781 RepID=A0A4S3TRK9_9EURY|nr:SDR family oxidoreductase [Salinadaptatus halalkaliphilus]THE65993.1 SDR family oxidoreductase [Salinadaptatus halalkaliphilus]
MSTATFSIDGDTALITGSSRGIGRTIAERFAADGVDIVVTSRDQDAVDAVADSINDSDAPGEALAVECDVRDRASIRSVVEAATDELDPIDILVNNAGASFEAPTEELSANAWNTILEINLTGAFNCAQIVGDGMIEGDGGTIINVSSVAGRDGAPMMAHYAAAKSGLDTLTRTLGVEWAPYEIRINGIMPGLVLTEGVEQQRSMTADDIDTGSVDRQLGLPDEIARVAQFLASPGAQYIQGETIVVEGTPRIALTEHHDM